MKNKKLLCIQPHSDDVLFSAAHFLFSDKYSVKVLTIENNEKRVKEDENLYSFLGIPYNHLEVPFVDESFYSFHKKYPEVTSENAEAHLKEFFGEKVVEEIRKEVIKFIEDFKKKHVDVQIVVPLGIGHPMHCFIRDVIESVTDNLWYYRDFPHSYKKRAKSELENIRYKYDILQIVSVEEFHDIKWDLAKKFYKSQSGLLWYEQGYIKKQLPEEVYSKKK